MPPPKIITPQLNKKTNQDYPLHETKREPLQLNENILFLKMFSNLNLMCIDLRISMIT